MEPEHFDVLIMGAGLSGICAGITCRNSAPIKATSFSSSVSASAGPGTCSAIRVFVPTQTCSRWAFRSDRGLILRP